MAETQKRQIAYKINVIDLIEGRYVKEEGWEPNYVLIADGRKVSRINILAIVVSKQTGAGEYPDLMIDDGTGKISLRSFGGGIDFDQFNIGDLITVIGRPREFNEQKYLVPEIIKKTDDKKWIEIRKLELQLLRMKFSGSMFEKTTHENKNSKNYMDEEVVEESDDSSKKFNETDSVSVENIQKDSDNPYGLIMALIKSIDNGNGADLQEICIKSKLQNAEEVVTDLLKEGEIFEIRPGRLKILS
ncbi:MAG: hypothetical protein Q8O89_05275 [Nanoarchaeota archaeon]|nr:hypothetical protein [Nanoarchaeota archaeon]